MAEKDLPAVAADQASAVAQALTNEAAMNAFISELQADQVAPFLAGLVNAATNIRALTKGLEQRLEADGETGQHYVIGGLEYAFFGAKQSGFRRESIETLLVNLGSLGIALPGIAMAVSDMRVTDLRALAAGLKDPEKREAALGLIEEARYESGERGAPSFKLMTDAMVAAKGKK